MSGLDKLAGREPHSDGVNDVPFHPLANIFPLIEGKELDDLAEDIRANGLRETIKLIDEQILDGRNRYRACGVAGVPARFEAFEGGDPLAYVISANLRRRHLNESQRSMVAAKLETFEHGGSRQDANLHLEITRADAAAMLNVSERSVASAKAVLESPELAKTVEHGLIKVDAAANLLNKPAAFMRGVIEKVKAGQKLTEAKRNTHRELLPAKVAALPRGQFRVIYADPPWRYGDPRDTDGYRQTGALDHYNDEDIENLKELDVKGVAAPDSVLFCWATFPLLTEALELVAVWGFKYKTAFVWDKKHGAFGHYHDADAELLLVATRGSCTPEVDKREKQIQRFARAGHSAKPDEWRTLIDRLYPSGPRIELFCRGEPAQGWTGWGAETVEAEAAE